MPSNQTHWVMTLVCLCAVFCAARPALGDDCNHNGVSDDQDIALGTSDDCNSNGIPDECEVYGEYKLTASDAALRDHFGYSVSISGDVAVIGAYWDDDAGGQSGSAYVYRFNGTSWIEETKLTASDAAAADYFGVSVSISGDAIVVGASLNDDDGNASGSAYVYRFNGTSWGEEAKLTASDAAGNDQFGTTVSINNDAVVIGAYRDDDGGPDSGSAYIFRYNGSSWTEEAKLTASDAATNDWFGYSSVSISGDAAVIGVYLDDDNGDESGSAYVFRFNGTNWIEEAKLTASDAAADDRFGYSVSISGDWAVIGAYRNDGGGGDSGAAYMYHFNGTNWDEEEKLIASDSRINDCFGISVSISDDVAVIGAYYDGILDSGSAYIYRWNGSNWIEEFELAASDAAASDLFGFTVSTSDRTVVIGAFRDDDAGDASGSAYVYMLPAAGLGQDCNHNDIPDECEQECNGNSRPDECDIADGTSQDCNLNDIPDECDLSSGTSFDCNNNGVLDECDLAQKMSQDCNNNGVPDECDIDSGTSLDCDGDGVPAECDADCNGNSVPDECDIVWHTSQDCNSDGVPDECDPDCNLNDTPDGCDIWNGTSQDCNTNNVPDECDIASQTSNDCNTNSIPDECEIYIERKITASDAAAYDHFGNAVSMSGDVALIGAPDDDVNMTDCGSAYIYRWDGNSWIQEAKLTASDKAPSDNFGWSVSISGDVAVIGSYKDDDAGPYTGSAYIFRKDGSSWIQETKLTAPNAAAYDHFGQSVSISGDVAVIGAYNYANSGSVFIYRYHRNSWVEEAVLTASDIEMYDYFGCDVAINGNLLAIGARSDDDGGITSSGSAYIYRYNGSNWIEEAKLTASDAAFEDFFGDAIAINNDVAVVGTYHDDDDGDMSGSAYVFRFNGASWVEEAKLTASDAEEKGYFGGSVSVEGNTVVIGACRAGSAYVYRFNGSSWIEETILNASDKPHISYYGISVAVSDNITVIGSYLDSVGANGTGSAYVYTIPTADMEANCNYDGVPDSCEPDCNSNGIADACDVTDGTSQDCNNNNVPDECDIADGSSQDCNSDGVPDECDPDCNNNGVPDGCDLWNGTNHDYNENGVLDECDIADGTSEDCDANGIPDECEIYTEHMLTASDAAMSDHFGIAVSISGDVAIIGAYLNDDGGSNSGSAYIYRWDGSSWIEETKLTASDAAENDYFGHGVAISGNVAIIGAHYDDEVGPYSGSAYVYRFNGTQWIEEAKLVASDTTSGDQFGLSVAISNNVAVIGAPWGHAGSITSGSAYVYRWDGDSWIEEAKLTASDAAEGDDFGYEVSVSGNVAVIGAYRDDDGGIDAGAAYIYRWDGTSWTEEAKLTASDATVEDYFGRTVSISNDVAVIGAYGNDDSGDFSGSAYVYRWDGSSWVEEAKLTAFDAAAKDFFGRGVSVSGDVAVIGAYRYETTTAPGSVYVYRWSGGSWILEAKLTASDAEENDYFGRAVAISGDTTMVGAYGNDDGGTNAGKAYIFNPPSPALEQDCNSNGTPDQCDIDEGTSQDCNQNGLPDECDIAFGTSKDNNSNGISDECELPMVTSAVSIKEHGYEIEFGIDVLDRTDNQDIECRRFGVTKLVVGFNTDVQGVGGLDTSDVSLSSGTVDAVSLSAGNELTIEMYDTADGIPLIVTFPGIINADNASLLCQDSVCIRQLVGDARHDGVINAADRIDVRNQMGIPVTLSNFRADVRADGGISAGDRIDVRNAMGNGFVGTCP